VTAGLLVALCGPAGSGKTTLVEQRDWPAHAVVRTDQLRLLLTDDEADQSANALVWDFAVDIAAIRLERGLLAVVDSTGPLDTRRRLLHAARTYHARAQLWVMTIPLDVCLTRNRSRDRVVPDAVVEQQFQETRSVLDGLAPDVNDWDDVVLVTYTQH